MKNIILITLCLFVGLAKGQTSQNKVTSLLKEVQKMYDVEATFQISSEYQLFKGNNGANALETYEGLVLKNNENSYNRINATEFIRIDKHSLKVNHNQKRAQYAPVENTRFQALDISSFLTFYIGQDIKETDQEYICELRSADLTPTPYSKVIIHIDKNTKRINKQILHYLAKKPFKTNGQNKEWDTPRLEITLSNYKTDIFEHLEKFDISNYLKFNGERVMSIGNLKGYQIVK